MRKTGPIDSHLSPSHKGRSAGDADYAVIGAGYTRYRRPEPRIAALIEQALGAAATVLNVGAGAGSYEPPGRIITAVEPSASMRAQRPGHLSAPIDAVAENLPFADANFDASMATFTVHQWSDLNRGLAEMRRVTRGPVVILTCDPGELGHFWLAGYAPRLIATEARRYPELSVIAAGLGGRAEILPVPIPLDCADGFNEAYYGRPEAFLDSGARLACSAWSFLEPLEEAAAVAALERDLADGSWDKKYNYLRKQAVFDGSLRLVIGR